jgi:hypothetical protein
MWLSGSEDLRHSAAPILIWLPKKDCTKDNKGQAREVRRWAGAIMATMAATIATVETSNVSSAIASFRRSASQFRASSARVVQRMQCAQSNAVPK